MATRMPYSKLYAVSEASAGGWLGTSNFPGRAPRFAVRPRRP